MTFDPLELLTVADLAAKFQVSEDTIRDMVARDAVPFIRVGRQIRFRRSDLEGWLAERREGAFPNVTAA